MPRNKKNTKVYIKINFQNRKKYCNKKHLNLYMLILLLKKKCVKYRINKMTLTLFLTL